MITQSLSSIFALWMPISANVSYFFPAGGADDGGGSVVDGAGADDG